MKRSSSAPCLAEEELENKKKRVKTCSDESRGPNTREYLQLALARVLELQRSLNDDTYFNGDTSDLEDPDNDESLMKHVLTKVFRDLPGSSSPVVTRIIERASRTGYTAEMERVRGKSVQLSGYDTCRKVAVDFMRRAAKAEDRSESIASRRRSIGDSAYMQPRMTNSEHELRTRMLTSLDLHLAAKQRDYVARLLRH